jgi:putative DNA primase/helicase
MSTLTQPPQRRDGVPVCLSFTARRGIPQRQRPASQPSAEELAEKTRVLMAGIVRGCSVHLDEVARYLEARGLKPRGEDLGEHPGLAHTPTRTIWPAMVARVRDVGGKITGLHRTYIDPTTHQKASVEPNKMMLGKCVGNGVRHSPKDDCGWLSVCEGIETGLAAMQIFPRCPVWGALSTSGMRAIELPATVKTIVILADRDPEGERAAQDLAMRALRDGRKVKIARPEHGCKDFNDQWKKEDGTAV